MPTNLIRRIDLDKLYPPFLEKALQVIAACQSRGSDYVATSGFRSYSEQEGLWMQGRLRPGTIVTNAHGGQSSHNFGLAVDVARRLPDGTFSWKPEDYAVYGEEIARLGLHWGITYKDAPHMSLLGFVSGAELKPLDDVYKAATGEPVDKLKEVWKALDNGHH